MIVSMKKLALLCLAREREETLASLQRLGLLHLEPLQEPQDDHVREARTSLEGAKTALSLLQRASSKASMSFSTG